MVHSKNEMVPWKYSRVLGAKSGGDLHPTPQSPQEK